MLFIQIKFWIYAALNYLCRCVTQYNARLIFKFLAVFSVKLVTHLLFFQAIKVSNAIKGDKSKYSDDEEEDEDSEEEMIPSPTLSKTWKTLYFVATLFKMVLVPVSLLFLVFACTRVSQISLFQDFYKNNLFYILS